MANLLLAPENWTPGDAWGGATFALPADSVPLVHTGPVADGDVVAFDIALSPTDSAGPDITITVNGATFAFIPGTALPAAFESDPLPAGAEVSISASARELHYVYEIGEIFNDVSRIGYAKVNLHTGQHTIMASVDEPVYAGMHQGGVFTNGQDAIFAAGFKDFNILSAYEYDGSAALAWVADWSPDNGPMSSSAVGVVALCSDGNRVFAAKDCYRVDLGQIVSRVYILDYDGVAFNETFYLEYLDGIGGFNEGSQMIKFGDYLVFHAMDPNAIRVLQIVGDTLVQTDSISFFETTWTEAPFISTDGSRVFFAGRPTGADADTIWAYSIDGSGQLVQDFSWPIAEVGGNMEGARAGAQSAVARGYLSYGKSLYAFQRDADSLVTPAMLSQPVMSFMPWGLDSGRSVLIAPTGIESMALAIDDDKWWDDAFPARDPLRNSGIFDLRKSFEFEEWGAVAQEIPVPDDGGVTYAESTIVVSGVDGTTCRAAVQLSATHTYYGDMRAELVAPDGQVSDLFFSNGSDVPVHGTHYANYVTPVSINGEWALRVYDIYIGDTGTLHSWSIGLVPAVLQSTLILHITGENQYARLEAGFVTPTEPLGGQVASLLLAPTAGVDTMNCDCDCGYPTETFKSMQDRVAVEMGYASQLAALQSGVLLQIKNALNFAQRRVVEDITEIQAIRYFSWQLEDGVSKYCTTDNLEACRNQLRAARIYEAYIQNAAGQIITRLIKGIPYDFHSGGDLDRSTPSRYEVRSCIELWPVPTGGQDLKLVVLGQLAAVDMVADLDTPSTTPDLIVMRAVAFMKSKKGHPDASDWMSQYRQTIGILNADGFIDERHIPNHVADRWAERLTHVMEPRIYLEP